MKQHSAEMMLKKTRAEAGLYEAFVALKSIDEARMFLQDLCTPAELQAMVDRWQVVPLLESGLSYQKIHDQTGVSVTTVGRVARSMMLGSGGYKLIYARLQNKGLKK